ncbi:hypothetical protein N7492_000006 [Penicillium capsulatum]|uniref:Threonylcarbamoyl-AMP synthase n=1 Tax=Penicillium capsulatum TaxID=69766 RepID=A0A9W9IPM6_9EURO|nr:hypothetical protein N7492_000006 [Penicillium capsulatum]KAJ6130921.1 hypothetical protein N7512_003701 [Penicillium capsulatum]
MDNQATDHQASNPRIVPRPGEVPNAKRDAAEAFAILQAGGTIIAPMDVGYTVMSASVEGIEKLFAAKKRQPGHTLGVIGTYASHLQLHDLPPEKYNITRTLTEELGMTIGVIAKIKDSARQLLPCLDQVTKNNTLGIAISEGPFQRELGRLNDENHQLVIGSSANVTGQGQKFVVSDIEPEILAAADLIVDYGRQKWSLYGRAGTVIDVENERVLRIGANYEGIREKLTAWFGWTLPEDPEFGAQSQKA